jgi:hypothetical protein
MDLNGIPDGSQKLRGKPVQSWLFVNDDHDRYKRLEHI